MSRALIEQMLDAGCNCTPDGNAAMQAAREYLAAPEQSEPVAYVTPFDWGSRETERVVKITRKPQPRYDYTMPVHPAPQSTAPEPVNQMLQGCACRWDANDNRVATCVRHKGWLDVVSEWAERAKAAEQAPQPTELTDAEIMQLDFASCNSLSFAENQIEFARAVLAAQRRKT